MKPKLAVVWFAVSMALTALLVVNWQKYRAQKLLLEKVQVQVEKLTQQEKAAVARADEAEKEARKVRAELRGTEVDLNSTRLAYNAMLQITNAPGGNAARENRPAGNQPAGGNMGSFLGNMMKDPEMRKAMEQQQRIGLDMMYGTLYKQLQLTPEQEKQFKETLLALQMTNMMQAGAMFDGSNTNRMALAQKMADDRRVAEEKIKEVLGEEKYGQFQDYNQTMGERVMLDQFAKQADVTPDQTEQLIGIIREEKKNVQINSGQQMDPTKDWQQIIQSGEAAEQLFSQQAQVNERVMERAAQILKPEQLQKLGPTLTNQMAMQRASLKMARQMFQTQGPGDPPKPQP